VADGAIGLASGWFVPCDEIGVDAKGELREGRLLGLPKPRVLWDAAGKTGIGAGIDAVASGATGEVLVGEGKAGVCLALGAGDGDGVNDIV
jgi:hypothetical protein